MRHADLGSALARAGRAVALLISPGLVTACRESGAKVGAPRLTAAAFDSCRYKSSPEKMRVMLGAPDSIQTIADDGVVRWTWHRDVYDSLADATTARRVLVDVWATRVGGPAIIKCELQ